MQISEMGFTDTSGSMSTLQAGSNLNQTIGNTEKMMILRNMLLSKTYIFNSKLVDGALVEWRFTIQNIILGFVTEDHLLDALDVAKVLDRRSRM